MALENQLIFCRVRILLRAYIIQTFLLMYGWRVDRYRTFWKITQYLCHHDSIIFLLNYQCFFLVILTLTFILIFLSFSLSIGSWNSSVGIVTRLRDTGVQFSERLSTYRNVQTRFADQASPSRWTVLPGTGSSRLKRPTREANYCQSIWCQGFKCVDLHLRPQ